MAAEYLRDRAGRSGLSHLVVDSAGTLDIRGAPASPEAVAALRELGLELSRHRSKGVREADLRTSDLVVVMGHDHLEALSAAFSSRGGKRVLLRAFERGAEPARDAPELADPIGRPIEQYRECLQTIVRCADHLLLHLKYLDPQRSG
jgi:protein-tyrosine-phosphatase